MIFTIINPLEYIAFGRQKVYLTANAFYAIPGKDDKGFKVAYFRKKQVVDRAKLFLFGELGKQKAFGGMWFTEFPVSLDFTYRCNKPGLWDIDNKGYFWIKIVLDLLKEKKAIPDDNINVIDRISMRYECSHISSMEFKFEEHGKSLFSL